MGWNDTTKVLTKPFTKIALNGRGDLQLALDRTSCFDEIQLVCDVNINSQRVQKVNVFSKYKGIQASPVMLSSNVLQVTSYKAGLEVVQATTINNFITEVGKAMNTNLTLAQDYMYKDIRLLCKVLRPDPEHGYPARALDFDGYKADAELDFFIAGASQDINIGPAMTWIPDGVVDLTQNVADQTLQDDSAAITEYLRTYANTTSIGNRTLLHAYDLINYQGGISTAMKRGVLIYPGGVGSTPMVAVETIPWLSSQGTSTDFFNTLASPHGGDATVVEFYCVPNQRYIAIPTFAYDVRFFSLWNFGSTQLDYDDEDKYINVIFMYDTDPALFGYLYFILQESNSQNGWDDISSTKRELVREHTPAPGIDFPTSGEWPRTIDFFQVLRVMEDIDTGKSFRIVIRGNKTTPSDPVSNYFVLQQPITPIP